MCCRNAGNVGCLQTIPFILHDKNTFISISTHSWIIALGESFYGSNFSRCLAPVSRLRNTEHTRQNPSRPQMLSSLYKIRPAFPESRAMGRVRFGIPDSMDRTELIFEFSIERPRVPKLRPGSVTSELWGHSQTACEISFFFNRTRSLVLFEPDVNYFPDSLKALTVKDLTNIHSLNVRSLLGHHVTYR